MSTDKLEQYKLVPKQTVYLRLKSPEVEHKITAVVALAIYSEYDKIPEFKTPVLVLYTQRCYKDKVCERELVFPLKRVVGLLTS